MATELSAVELTKHAADRTDTEVRIVDSLQSFKTVRREWERLEAASKAHSFCLSYQYCELAASRAIENGGFVVLIMVYADGELAAIWPFAVARNGLLHIAKVMSCGSYEECGGPVSRGPSTASIVSQCVQAAMRIPADVIEIPFVRTGSVLEASLELVPQAWTQQVVPRRMRVIPGYSITLRGLKNWDEYFNGLSKGFRRNLRRYRNALSETGETELGWCTTFDDAVRVLTWLFENKRQWAEDRGLRTRYLMGNEVRDFFIELARRTDLRVTPLVAFVKVNGVPVAASINLVGPQSVEYWMFTYDKAYSRYSVGNLLTEFVVRWAHANDRDFDMRTAYNEYKTYWANRETVNQTRYVFLTARGRAFEAWLVCYYLNRVQRGLRTRIASVLRAALINRVRR